MARTPKRSGSGTRSSHAAPALTDLDRDLARSSPAGFAWLAGGQAEGDPSTGWLPLPHLMLLSERLVAVAEGRLPRLIVTMPPRHGKSELISRFAPAWYLGTYPNRKVMLASYEAGFAATWGRKARDELTYWGPSLFGVGVSEASQASDYWEVAGREGVMVTAGVGGGLTGKGAHLLVIDDPVKNSEQASSEVIQAKHWDWWISTARTRLQKGGGVVLVMTRWHENDLAGQLLAHAQQEGGEPWEVLNLPALAEDPTDPLGRQEGEALCPELMPLEQLLTTRRVSGSYWWSAMYQQRPMPAEGGVFKRADFRYWHEEELPDNRLVCVLRKDADRVEKIAYDHLVRFVTVDPALSEKQTADYTAICHWGVTPNRDLLLLDVERLHFDAPKQEAFIEGLYASWRPMRLDVEDKAHGTALVQHLARKGLPVSPRAVDTDKVTRARGAVPRYEVHQVFHRAGAPWLEPYERELLSFPNGRNDDQVDCYSMAALALPGLAPAKGQQSTGRTMTGGLGTAQL